MLPVKITNTKIIHFFDLCTAGLLRLNSKDYNTIKLYLYLCFGCEDETCHNPLNIRNKLDLSEEEYEEALGELVEKGFSVCDLAEDLFSIL